MIITKGKGRIHANRFDATYLPRRSVPRPAVVFCHGYNGTAQQASGEEYMGIEQVLTALSNKLLLPVVAATGADGFGNAISKTESIDDALTYARANLNASNAKAVLVGISMGTAVALDYAADHPDRVACVIAILPVIDQQAIRDANTVVGGQNLRNAIDTAHGVVYPAPLPAGVDVATRTAALQGFPIQLWYASGDAVSVNVGTFAAAVNCEIHDVGALGHTPAAIVAVDKAQVVSFVAAHL